MTRALIVIDIQADYFPGGALPLEGAEPAETGIARAIAAARQAGDRVILVRHLGPAGGALLAGGSPGAGLRPAIVAAAPDAPVIDKRFADAFQETGLAQLLDGVRVLMICGMMTQNCVLMTALEGLRRGYDVTVLPELCAAPSGIVHRVALGAIGSKLALAAPADLW